MIDKLNKAQLYVLFFVLGLFTGLMMGLFLSSLFLYRSGLLVP